jgi:hypothetical protein
MVIEVHLRTLQGATLCARMAEGCTVADLQSCLKQQHSIKRATLYIQVCTCVSGAAAVHCE